MKAPVAEGHADTLRPSAHAASALSKFGPYVSVAGGLVRLVFRPCTLEAAEARVRHHLAMRNQNFLRIVREGIWNHSTSPYRRLLTWAGWSFDMLVEGVRRRGLEATLEALRDAGVYLTHEEFKGRRPVQRDGLTLECTESDFDHPGVQWSIEVRTGATRSQGSRVPASLDYLADQRAPAWRISLEALGPGSWPVIIWMPSVSHGGGLMWWLALMHMGRPTLRWFSVTDPSGEAVSPRHRAMFRMGQLAGKARGLRIPYPEHVSLADGDAVLDVVHAARARHGGCIVVTSASAATRLAALAGHGQTDLERVSFLVGGEPLTRGKHDEIKGSGAGVGVRYAVTEAGAVGGTCGRPVEIDDVHFLSDSFALILNERQLPDGRSADAFVLTTLLPSSPKVLLNVENDDFGNVVERRCGCMWDAFGMHTHLSTIRSFSKLTGEGVTVLGSDCLRILEEVLPREFGGRSIDYQLLEAEDSAHLTRLYLVVSPAVGPINEAKLRSRFIEELRDWNRPRSLMPPLWRLADTIRVVRREPVPTVGGKLLPFHTQASMPGEGEPTREGVRE